MVCPHDQNHLPTSMNPYGWTNYMVMTDYCKSCQQCQKTASIEGTVMFESCFEWSKILRRTSLY